MENDMANKDKEEKKGSKWKSSSSLDTIPNTAYHV